MPKAAVDIPPQSELVAVLAYDPETGVLSRSGKPVGTKNSSGYLTASVLGRGFLVHRLVWQIVHGDVNGKQVDHINGDKADNRLGNLRAASDRTNSWNKGLRKSKAVPFKGVILDKERGNYRAQIVHDGRKFNLGRYDTPEAAAAAYKRAAVRKFGFFANDGLFGTRTSAVSAVAESFAEWRKARV